MRYTSLNLCSGILIYIASSLMAADMLPEVDAFFNSSKKWEKEELACVLFVPRVYGDKSGEPSALSTSGFGEITDKVKIDALKKSFNYKSEPDIKSVYPGGKRIRAYFLYKTKGFSIDDCWECLISKNEVYVLITYPSGGWLYIPLPEEFAKIIRQTFIDKLTDFDR